MGFEKFIAQHLLDVTGKERSGSLLRIATATVALGVAVMLLSTAIVRGFQNEIEQKVAGFGSHLTVKSFEVNDAYNATPIVMSDEVADRIKHTEGVVQLQRVAVKGGMIKTRDQIHGILLKGVDKGYDTTFFANHLSSGRFPLLSSSTPSNEILISKRTSDKLGIALGDKVRTYYWQDDHYRARAFKVCGIYTSDLEEFDDIYLVGDLRQVQRLYGWDSSEVGSYEILVDQFDRIDEIGKEVVYHLPYDLEVKTIAENNPTLFSWLQLLNSNVLLILCVMGLVCAVAAISSFLIMVFEKTATIGLLKVMGARNSNIKKIFLLKFNRIILNGIIIGDLIALIISLVQRKWHLIHLDPESYSMSVVPIDINPWAYLSVSVATWLLCYLAQLLPATFIARVKPAQTLKVN